MALIPATAISRGAFSGVDSLIPLSRKTGNRHARVFRGHSNLGNRFDFEICHGFPMDGETMGFEGVFTGEKTSAICADENFLLIVRLVVSVLVATQISTVGESHSTLVTLKER